MFHSLLVPLDGSKRAESAIPLTPCEGGSQFLSERRWYHE